jgi:alpha-glucosidase
MVARNLLLGLVLWAQTAFTVPAPQDELQQGGQLIRRAGNPDNCPGYTASNVVKTASSLTADLTLAGDPCNALSDDIKNLKLLVEYQSRKNFPFLVVHSRLLL